MTIEEIMSLIKGNPGQAVTELQNGRRKALPNVDNYKAQLDPKLHEIMINKIKYPDKWVKVDKSEEGAPGSEDNTIQVTQSQNGGGTFQLESEEGKGTKLTASMDTGNIDCLPLGDLSGTLLSLMLTNPLFPDFLFEGKSPKGEGTFDTREVRQALGSDIPFNEPSVAAWLKEALDEEINSIFGGVMI